MNLIFYPKINAQITQNIKFTISLQYLKKQFYKLISSFLKEMTRHVQNTQNRKLVIFLHVASALSSTVMQNIQVF